MEKSTLWLAHTRHTFSAVAPVCIVFLSILPMPLEILRGGDGGKLCLLEYPGELSTSAVGMLTGALSDRKRGLHGNGPELEVEGDAEG